MPLFLENAEKIIHAFINYDAKPPDQIPQTAPLYGDSVRKAQKVDCSVGLHIALVSAVFLPSLNRILLWLSVEVIEHLFFTSCAWRSMEASIWNRLLQTNCSMGRHNHGSGYQFTLKYLWLTCLTFAPKCSPTWHRWAIQKYFIDWNYMDNINPQTSIETCITEHKALGTRRKIH